MSCILSIEHKNLKISFLFLRPSNCSIYLYYQKQTIPLRTIHWQVEALTIRCFYQVLIHWWEIFDLSSTRLVRFWKRLSQLWEKEKKYVTSLYKLYINTILKRQYTLQCHQIEIYYVPLLLAWSAAREEFDEGSNVTSVSARSKHRFFDLVGFQLISGKIKSSTINCLLLLVLKFYTQCIYLAFVYNNY